MKAVTLKRSTYPLKIALAVLASTLIAMVICLAGVNRAYAESYTAAIDTLDDGYIAEAGTNNWTTEHDVVYQTYVGDTLDLCSDMSLDSVLTQMNAFETLIGVTDTSGIALSGTNGDLTVTIQVPKGCEINVGGVYMVDNDLYEITGRSTTDTVVGPGSFTLDMSLKESYTTYDALKTGISGLAACDMASTVPNDGFQHEIRVVFPGVKINSDMLDQQVAVGMGTMTGQFSATASMYNGLIQKPFTISLTSHQYEGGVDANLDPASTITSVTVKVNPAASVTVTKTWNHGSQAESDWPTAATVHLLADGTEVSSATLSADNSWAYTFGSLDPSKTYTVTEDAIEDYNTVIGTLAGTAADGYTVGITNTYDGTVTPTGTVSVKATKVWNDSDNKDGIRPDSVTLQLQKTVSGTTSDVTGTTVVLNAANNWTATLKDLPATENGADVTYSFTEPSVPSGYTVSYSSDGLTVTNTHTVTGTTTTTTTTTGTTAGSTKTTSPKTGDNMMLPSAFALIGMVAASLIVVAARRRKNERF